ncbi:DNA polymerase II large subunit [archaeon]|nr:MAG: DNA polymerase II large subunit [archaeon]
MVSSMSHDELLKSYHDILLNKFEECLRVASQAKKARIDPEEKIESLVVYSHAEAIEKLIGLPSLSKTIQKLSEEYSNPLLAFKLAEKIIEDSLGAMSREKAALLAIRAGLAVLTPPGTTSAPIEGIVEVRIKRNLDGSEYLAVYFAGPMRSAGGTEQAVAVLLADYIRRKLGLNRYIPTRDEIYRFIEELRLYERDVGRFQYKIRDEELRFTLQNIPIEVTGHETDPIEVSLYRDLPRIETNQVRGGALRVVNDGIIGRARKVMNYVSLLKFDGWEWLNSIRVESKVKESYLDQVVIGRPVFSVENFGGFRIRLGRCRNTGLASVGIHPCTMFLSKSFLAIGTQLRLSKPSKSAIVMSVDTIHPPVVLLKDGSVLRVEDISMAEAIEKNIEKILFLGDILISLGDFIENNMRVPPSPYVEEWWVEDLKSALKKTHKSFDEDIMRYIKDPFYSRPSPEEAIHLSRTYHIPLHPYYTFFWRNISKNELIILSKAIKNSRKEDNHIILIDHRIKKILEKLCIPHKLSKNKEIVIDYPYSLVLVYLFRNPLDTGYDDVLEILSKSSGILLRDTIGVYVGARMGRPEAAKPRKLNPPVHTLFPVGLKGGPSRDLMKAFKERILIVDLAYRYCKNCKSTTFFRYCETCKSETIPLYYCPNCHKRNIQGGVCNVCGAKLLPYMPRNIDLKSLLERSAKMVNILSPPKVIKGVKSLMNPERLPEHPVKGILRALFDLFVFRDGTTRFEASNAPLTSFKPSEIGIDIRTALELGYRRDIYGNPIESEGQEIFLYPQDIIIPKSAAEYLVKVSKFLDSLLKYVYHVDSFYNLNEPKDLIGHLVIGISPHTYGGIIGRIIGFTDCEVIFAHPFWHQAKRRDCDGDADSIILLMDVFLNFSRHFLPERPGGMMDSPILLFPILNPHEIDDQVYNMENEATLSCDFYNSTMKEDSAPLARINTVGRSLLSDSYFFKIFATHSTSSIQKGVLRSSYREFSIQKKLELQLSIMKTLNNFPIDKIVERILDSHILRDIAGNLRAFYSNSVRCKYCGLNLSRPTLSGRCPNCGGELVRRVYSKSVIKYLKIAEFLVNNFNLSNYYKQYIDLLKKESALLLYHSEGKQKRLTQYF